MNEIEHSLAAVSLMFTVLTYFVTLRVSAFDLHKLTRIGISSGVQALIDLVIAATAGLVLAIIWPLMHSSFAGFANVEAVLPNLLGVIAVGFALLGLIEAFIGFTRLLVGIRNALK